MTEEERSKFIAFNADGSKIDPDSELLILRPNEGAIEIHEESNWQPKDMKQIMRGRVDEVHEETFFVTAMYEDDPNTYWLEMEKSALSEKDQKLLDPGFIVISYEDGTIELWKNRRPEFNESDIDFSEFSELFSDDNREGESD